MSRTTRVNASTEREAMAKADKWGKHHAESLKLQGVDWWVESVRKTKEAAGNDP